MIPKVVKAKDGKGSGGNGFRGAIEYISKKTNHTVALRNLDSLASAPRDMRAIAGPAAAKPVYHLILSWAALEVPTDDQMVAAADAALARLGLSDHQAVIAVHRDRDHQHVHIVVNKIGMDGRPANLSHDYAKLEKACREIEHLQGWAQDRGRFEPVILKDGTATLKAPAHWPDKKQRPTDGEIGREQRTGEEPLSEYLRRDDVIEEIGACFDMARSWDELHQMLARHGLRYAAKGSGAKLISIRDDTDTASPSHVDKDWARSKLERRLGPLVDEIVAHDDTVATSPPHSSLYADLVARLGADLLSLIERDGVHLFRLSSGAEVRDSHDRITATAGADDRAIECMVAIAQSKGWKSVKLSGSEEFQRLAGAMLAEAGIKVQCPDSGDGKALTRDIGPCWQRYQAARKVASAARHHQANERETLSRRHTEERGELRVRQNARSALVQSLFPKMPPFTFWDHLTQRREREALRQRHQVERAELRAFHDSQNGQKVPDWRSWLGQQARAGDQEAVRILERQQARHQGARIDRREELKREAEMMRRIDLPKLAEAMGYVRDAKESTQKSLKYRRGAEVVIMARAQDGTWSFFNGQVAGDQGGVWQFAQMRLGRPDPSSREIADFLRPHLSSADQAAAPAEVQDRERDHTAARQSWAQAKASAPAYLTERGIIDATNQLYCQGDQVRQDRRGNALFAHRDQAGNIVGFEVKGPRWSGFAKGGQKTLAIFGTPEARQMAGRIVVTESGIDALSLAQTERRRDTLYLSTGGSVGQRTLTELKALLERHPDAAVMLGFDNDPAGDAFADQVASHLGRPSTRLRPALKDWNDDLHQIDTATTRRNTRNIK